MTVYYEVVPNNLKEGHYYPRVIQGKRVALDQIIKEVSYETVLTDTDIRAALNGIARRVAFYLGQGDLPDLEGLVSFSISLSDNITSAKSSLSEEVEVRFNAQVSPTVIKLASQELTFERVYSRTRSPQPVALFDARSKLENHYTAGRVVRLNGDALKFDSEASDEGVFFISVADSTVTRADIYLDTGMRQVTFNMPDGITGDQTLEVRTRYGGPDLVFGRLKGVVKEAT